MRWTRLNWTRLNWEFQPREVYPSCENQEGLYNRGR